jgi:hypothetical protein
VELAREVLAPHGLAPQPVASGVYARVRQRGLASTTRRSRKSSCKRAATRSRRTTPTRTHS